MLCVKHSVPEMVASGGGSFVGMSSIAGHQNHPHFGAYTVSKAGIEAMMRNAADEFGRSNLRFNAIRPGFIATEMMDFVPRDGEVFASYLRNTPLAPASDTVDGGQALRSGPDFSSFIAPRLGDDVMAGNRPADD